MVKFEKMKKIAQLEYVGQFLCWLGEKQVNLLNLTTNSTRAICLLSFLDKGIENWQPELVQINAC